MIAVVADANNLEEEWTTKWEENKFPKIQQFQVSQAELGWISRKEMPRKIEEIRKSLIIHAGMDNLMLGGGVISVIML